MGGTVELLFELSVDSHEAATFLCEDADLFCHVGWTLAFRVAVEFGFAVGVVVVPVQAVGNHQNGSSSETSTSFGCGFLSWSM